MHPYESVAPRTRKNVLCGTPTRFGDINLPGLAQFWTQHSAGRFSPGAARERVRRMCFMPWRGVGSAPPLQARSKTNKIRTSRMPYQLQPSPMARKLRVHARV
jgi:hypothetical protein